MQTKINHDMQPAAFVNHYAAMPSLPFAWNLLLGIAALWASRNLRAWAFAVAMPVAMGLSVIVTANRFILDLVAATVVALIGLAVALMLERQGPRPWRSLAPRALPGAPTGGA